MVRSPNELDNYQHIRMTGSSEPIEKCTTCHLTEPSADFFHRVAYDYFWSEKRDGVRARKYLQMGLRLAPGDARLAADLAVVQ